MAETEVRPDPAGRNVAAVILAGGGGRRMGGLDKGLLSDRSGVPLVRRVLDTLPGGIARVLISANRNLDEYRRFDPVEVVTDHLPGGLGPLAGVHAALLAVAQPYLLVLPCDSASPPPDLLARLAGVWIAGTGIAVAHDGERLQPLFSLWAVTERQSLEQYLAGGRRRVDRYVEERGARIVKFTGAAPGFGNINSPEDYQHWIEAGVGKDQKD